MKFSPMNANAVFLLVFCVLGMVIFGLVIFISLDAHYHRTK